MAWRSTGLALLAAWCMTAMADPLADAQARFDALHGYQVTLRSADAAGTRQVIRYFYRKPGWVRMEFEQPHRGAVLIYAPDSRRVRLWPFGAGSWPELDLAPDNPLLRDSSGHRVDRSDLGALLANIRALRERGSAAPPSDTALDGRPATLLDIRGAAGDGTGRVQRYRVWLAQDLGLPLRVDSFAAAGALIESVDMGDLRVDGPLPERFFTP